MPTVQYQTNMKCESCLSKVGAQLNSEPNIESWEADLEDPGKIIRAEVPSRDDRRQVAESIRRAGFEATELPESAAGGAEASASHESAAGHDSQHQYDGQGESATSSDESNFSFRTYKPLFLVVAYVIGGTVFAESFHESFVWSRAMTWFMGFFFVAFAFFKLLDVSKFADAFATYDVIGKRSRAYGLSYPFVELGLGLLFLSGQFLLAANVLTVAVMAMGLIGVIAAVRKKQAIQCACLGTVFNLPMSVVTIIENSTMILMAAAMIWKLL